MTADRTYTVALDVMGADSGLEAVVAGGLQALKKVGESLRVVFVGRQEEITRILSTHRDITGNVSVQHAEREVPMHISATDGVRMRDSSITVGLSLVRDRQADAFVSPGNT
ncbi:MAG: phosphate--acyl-ACP acyltransferase, partial [candidate division Zixibacteria bacterium]|nr:phosphate--acyl-ACP acyltransferase [candidate division Zixibacteria bacterium]